MDDILGKSVGELPGLEFDCSCRKRHAVGIKNIVVGSEIGDAAAQLAAYYGQGRIFLMADVNTYAACGKRLERQLKDEGFNVDSCVLKSEGVLLPDERALGRLFAEIGASARLIICVGSGTLGDLARMLSFRLHIPYFAVCTAPSMDGYASCLSSLVADGAWKTFDAVCPDSIIADISILKEAPYPMIKAGFGDMVGKLTCLADWELANELSGEYYCETAAKLVFSAVQKCLRSPEGLSSRDEAAVKDLTEALILSGVAMTLVGSSQPASGAEHCLSHFWEMDAVAHGRPHALHGSAVGVGTVVIASIYELMGDRVPADCHPPKPGEIAALLRRAGACDNPKDLGIERGLFRESVVHAHEARPRYTVLSLASSYGLLEQFADELSHRFYD